MVVSFRDRVPGNVSQQLLVKMLALVLSHHLELEDSILDDLNGLHKAHLVWIHVCLHGRGPCVLFSLPTPLRHGGI